MEKRKFLGDQHFPELLFSQIFRKPFFFFTVIKRGFGLNTLQNDKILARSKLNAFADKLIVAYIM